MAKLKNKISYLLALVIPVFSVSAVADEPTLVSALQVLSVSGSGDSGGSGGGSKSSSSDDE